MRTRRLVTTLAMAAITAGSISAAPVLAQDPAYAAALESGDLASLIPEPFADADLMDGMSFGASLGPPGVDSPSAGEARSELLAIIDGAGLTIDDVATITGFAEGAGGFASFSAVRVPGIPAVDWFEPYFQVALSRNYSDPVRSLVEVGPKSVLRIADRGSDRSDLLYAQGEILWLLAGDDDVGAAFLDGLATIDGPALSVDPGAPRDGEPVTPIGTVEDPVSQIPAEILGVETATQTIPAASLFERIDPDDAEAVAMADAFGSVLEAAGGVDRSTIISSQAVGDDGGILIVGLHVEGADHTAFRKDFVDLFVRSELASPQEEETQLGGKAVTRISDADAMAGDVAYIYGVGGTAWILRGQDEYIAALLRTMP